MSEDTCGAMCNNCSDENELGNLHSRLYSKLMESLKVAGKGSDHLHSDLLLVFWLFSDVDSDPDRALFAVVSGFLGKHPGQRDDLFLWTQLEVDGASMFVPSERNVKDICLRHSRVACEKLATPPRDPFDCSNVGSFKDCCTDDLLAMVVRTSIRPASALGCRMPRKVEIQRVIESRTLHPVDPLDCYICLDVCDAFRVVSEERVVVAAAAAAAAPVPGPAPAAPSAPKALARPSFLLEAMHGGSGMGGKKMEDPRDCGLSQYEHLLQGSLADVGLDVAVDFQQAMMLLEEEERQDTDGGDSDDDCIEPDVGEHSDDEEHSASETDGDEEEDVVATAAKQKRCRTGDASTYGVEHFSMPNDWGDICWSFGRSTTSAHCCTPLDCSPLKRLDV